MDTSKTFPVLAPSDPVASTIEYSQRVAAAAGQGVAWTDLTLLNGWTYVSGYTPQVKKFGNLVEVRGLLKVPATHVGVAAFILPVGYRPSGQSGMWGDLVFGSSSKAITMPYIYTSGQVNPIHSVTYTTGTFTVSEFLRLHAIFGVE